MTDEAKAPMGGEVEEAVKRLTWMLGNAEGAANYDVLPDPDRDEASKDAAVFRAALAALAQPKEGEATPPDLTDEVVEGMVAAAIDDAVNSPTIKTSGGITEEAARASRRRVLEATIDWRSALLAALRLLPRAPAPSPKGQEAEGWKPMDQAPKDGTTILLWDDVHRVAVSGRWHVEPETNSPNCFDPGWADWSADNDAVMWDDGGYGPLLWRHIDLPATSPTRDEGRNPSQLWARDLTDAELIGEYRRNEEACDRFDEARRDPDYEGHGGSPGEGLYERSGELEGQLKKRGLWPVPHQEGAVR